MASLFDKLFGSDQKTKATKRETEKGVQERQGQTQVDRTSEVGQQTARETVQDSTTTGSQTAEQTAIEETSLFREAQFGELAGLLTSLTEAAGSPTGFATEGALSEADRLSQIAGDLTATAAGTREDVLGAAEAARDIELLSFEEDVGGQLSNLARTIGSKDNTAFQRIAARERGKLATRLAGITTDAAVRGSELELGGLSAAAGASGAAFEAANRLGTGRSEAVSSVADIAGLLRGAEATRTATGTSEAQSIQELASAISGLEETSRTENTSEVTISKIIEALTRESDIFGQENIEGVSAQNSIFNQLVDFVF